MYHKRSNNKDLVYVLSNLRAADCHELEVLYGTSDLDMVIQHWKHYKGVRIACLDDGTPVAVFGLCVVSDKLAGVGFLATNDVEKELRSFLIKGRKWVDAQLKKYKKLANYVYSANTKAVKWLKWLGFEVENHSGIGEKFLYFSKVYGG